jgi:hypothetical protein
MAEIIRLAGQTVEMERRGLMGQHMPEVVVVGQHMCQLHQIYLARAARVVVVTAQ